MKQKKWLSLYLLVIALLILTGCTKVLPDQTAQLVLSGFPDQEYRDTYQVYVSQIGDSGQIKYDLFENVKISEVFTQNISISQKADMVVAYLFSDTTSSSPSYFWLFNPKKGTTFRTNYWLNYYAYTDSKIRYGVASSMAQSVDANVLQNMDFTKQPYYLFKLSNIEKETIQLDLSMEKGGVMVNYKSRVLELGWPDAEVSDKKSITIDMDNLSHEADTLYVLAYPEHYDEETKGTITFGMDNSLTFDGRLERIFSTGQPDVMYGVNLYNKFILPVHLQSKSLGTQITIPMDYVSDAEYSPKDEKMYLVNRNHLTIWDAVTGNFQTVDITDPNSSWDIIFNSISIAPKSRKIYIYGNRSLFVLNQDTYELVARFYLNDGESIYVDESREKMYLVDWWNYDENVYVYSLKDGACGLEQTIYHPHETNILMSPDKSQLLLPSYLGNGGAGSTIYAFDPMNLENVLGEWFVGVSPIAVCFSPDSSKLYGYGSGEKESTIYVMDAKNYTQIKKIPVKKDSYVLMQANSDGSTLVYAASNYLRTTFTFLQDIH